jgi:hypothetical protein
LATLQDIIDFLDRKLPNHGESNANIVKDLQDIHLDIYLKLQRLSNTFEIEEMDSVADQLEYDLPTGVEIENIIELLVSTNESTDEYETYSYRGTKDSNIMGRYYGRAEEGKIFIRNDQQALRFDDLVIKIKYYKTPTALSVSTLTQVPDLDSKYHDLLKYKIVSEIASQGHDPNIEVANYWRSRYDEKLRTVLSDLEINNLTAYNQIPEQKERW